MKVSSNLTTIYLTSCSKAVIKTTALICFVKAMFNASLITVTTAGLLSALFLFQKHEIVPLPEVFKSTPIVIDKTYRIEPEPFAAEKLKVEQILPKETVKNLEPKIVIEDVKPEDQKMATVDELKGKESGAKTESNPTGSDVASVSPEKKTDQVM
ncbi:hypothetical protein [Solitalea koreensis]|uniref:Uncharacterized protein n=1 Tax=Solitalea koreensis TaxID=543615 RepID=A0A521D882_9SPHI|nr:hypothetical protein [Solitalea koreensis]SMO67904.1 hypothetical protein SAMN06265350_10657 [Solitalea koreensis]